MRGVSRFWFYHIMKKIREDFNEYNTLHKEIKPDQECS